jgi:hypothetical protein
MGSQLIAGGQGQGDRSDAPGFGLLKPDAAVHLFDALDDGEAALAHGGEWSLCS